VTEVVWDPEERKPENAAALETGIDALAPGARVKLTWRGEEWQVRALAPAALCGRGGSLEARDLSSRVADFLNDEECPAAAR
jgi:hypothetical protein